MSKYDHWTNLDHRHQDGIVTTFTGVLILVLLTLMMFFAIRVGVFEQRVSSNEIRHSARQGVLQSQFDDRGIEHHQCPG